LDRGENVAAQRFSQILSPDAPPAFEKSRLGAALVNACNPAVEDASPDSA
jgi:hypothetical protein